jgi:tRNA-binding EMAP/Myf-like protein
MADLVVGRVLAVQEHPGARAPSFLLRVDAGPRGEVEASLERGSYGAADLEGAQIVVDLAADEALVVAAHSHGAGLILVRPDREVEPGTVVT